MQPAPVREYTYVEISSRDTVERRAQSGRVASAGVRGVRLEGARIDSKSGFLEAVAEEFWIDAYDGDQRVSSEQVADGE